MAIKRSKASETTVKMTLPAMNVLVSAVVSPDSKKRRNAPGVAMAQMMARDPDAAEEKRTKGRLSSAPNLMAKRLIAAAMIRMRAAARILTELSLAA